MMHQTHIPRAESQNPHLIISVLLEISLDEKGIRRLLLAIDAGVILERAIPADRTRFIAFNFPGFTGLAAGAYLAMLLYPAGRLGYRGTACG